ncbi:hypothetical protein NEIRO03_1551 [Nematocida sp. AWRm78]|nr:hypothetical protein NEIRO02_1579 [Nematocida sp. AWRm79]KAI5184085.1 hypothetical protein NEIRO03_1551 [Nematocida sp. AWRm78]
MQQEYTNKKSHPYYILMATFIILEFLTAVACTLSLEQSDLKNATSVEIECPEVACSNISEHIISTEIENGSSGQDHHKNKNIVPCPETVETRESIAEDENKSEIKEKENTAIPKNTESIENTKSKKIKAKSTIFNVQKRMEKNNKQLEEISKQMAISYEQKEGCTEENSGCREKGDSPEMKLIKEHITSNTEIVEILFHEIIKLKRRLEISENTVRDVKQVIFNFEVFIKKIQEFDEKISAALIPLLGYIEEIRDYIKKNKENQLSENSPNNHKEFQVPSSNFGVDGVSRFIDGDKWSICSGLSGASLQEEGEDGRKTWRKKTRNFFKKAKENCEVKSKNSPT